MGCEDRGPQTRVEPIACRQTGPSPPLPPIEPRSLIRSLIRPDFVHRFVGSGPSHYSHGVLKQLCLCGQAHVSPMVAQSMPVMRVVAIIVSSAQTRRQWQTDSVCLHVTKKMKTTANTMHDHNASLWGAWAMRQRILGSHTPPCHRRMVITTQFSVLPCCTAAGLGEGGVLPTLGVGATPACTQQHVPGVLDALKFAMRCRAAPDQWRDLRKGRRSHRRSRTGLARGRATELGTAGAPASGAFCPFRLRSTIRGDGGALVCPSVPGHATSAEQTGCRGRVLVRRHERA